MKLTVAVLKDHHKPIVVAGIMQEVLYALDDALVPKGLQTLCLFLGHLIIALVADDLCNELFPVGDALHEIQCAGSFSEPFEALVFGILAKDDGTPFIFHIIIIN